MVKIIKHSTYLLFFFVFFIPHALIFPSDNLSYDKSAHGAILITIDALRPDHLGCYGYRRNTSPYIDKLAREGVIFKQAIAQASVTIVSLASLLTSLYPSRHGIITQHLDINKDFRCPTILEILKNKNYRIAVFLPDNAAISIPKWTHRFADYTFIYPHQEGSSDYSIIIPEIVRWLKSNPKQDFFIWVHYRGVHAPYKPPMSFQRLFVDDKFYDSHKKIPLVDNIYGWGGISPKANLNNIQELGYYISQYDGALKYVDYWIGQLIYYLEKEGFYDNTAIIVSADHGEAFGEHNLYFEHANTLYDELLKVPLIIRFPQGAYRGRIVEKQTRLVDIMPTLLQYLNLEIPYQIDGESLSPLMKGGDEYRYRAIFSLSMTAEMEAVRCEDWKLIHYKGQPNRYELYNLKKDSNELKNLYDKEPYVFKRLSAELNRLLSGFSCCGEESKDDYAIRRANEILRSLGYVQ